MFKEDIGSAQAPLCPANKLTMNINTTLLRFYKARKTMTDSGHPS